MPEHYRLPYTLRGPCAETKDTYLAEVPVLRGCRAWGATPAEALGNLYGVASEFVAACKHQGDELPEGIVSAGELVIAVCPPRS